MAGFCLAVVAVKRSPLYHKIQPLMMAVIAGLLFPVHGSVTDYRAFYYKQFRRFFALQFLWLSLDIVEVTAPGRKAELNKRRAHASATTAFDPKRTSSLC